MLLHFHPCYYTNYPNQWGKANIALKITAGDINFLYTMKLVLLKKI